MSKYIIKAELNPMGGGNPEYAPDQELVKGIEADGFLLMTMKDDRPGAVVIHSITTLDLARMLAGDKSEAGSVIRQAMAISEGLLKAEEIKKTEDRNTMARNLAEILRSK